MAKQRSPEYYRRFAWASVGLVVLSLGAGCLRLRTGRGFPHEFGIAVAWATSALMYFGNASRRERGLLAYDFKNVWTDFRSPIPERQRDALDYAAMMVFGIAVVLVTFIEYWSTIV